MRFVSSEAFLSHGLDGAFTGEAVVLAGEAAADREALAALFIELVREDCDPEGSWPLMPKMPFHEKDMVQQEENETVTEPHQDT